MTKFPLTPSIHRLIYLKQIRHTQRHRHRHSPLAQARHLIKQTSSTQRHSHRRQFLPQAESRLSVKHQVRITWRHPTEWDPSTYSTRYDGPSHVYTPSGLSQTHTGFTASPSRTPSPSPILVPDPQTATTHRHRHRPPAKAGIGLSDQGRVRSTWWLPAAQVPSRYSISDDVNP